MTWEEDRKLTVKFDGERHAAEQTSGRAIAAFDRDAALLAQTSSQRAHTLHLIRCLNLSNFCFQFGETIQEGK